MPRLQWPSRVPLLNHLRVRADAELSWDDLLSAIDAASRHRVPPLTEANCFSEIVVGFTPASRIESAIKKVRNLKARIKKITKLILLDSLLQEMSAAVPRVKKISAAVPIVQKGPLPACSSTRAS
jgi:hypothetical protein